MCFCSVEAAQLPAVCLFMETLTHSKETRKTFHAIIKYGTTKCPRLPLHGTSPSMHFHKLGEKTPHEETQHIFPVDRVQ